MHSFVGFVLPGDVWRKGSRRQGSGMAAKRCPMSRLQPATPLSDPPQRIARPPPASNSAISDGW